MEKFINEKESSSSCTNESSVSDNKKESKQNQYSNLYTALIDSLSNEKSDTDKIKALILLEKDFLIIKDKNKIFDNFLNDHEGVYSNILKGQILMTTTTILILLCAKDEYPHIFLNFVDNVLIENIKNTNNYANIYLRQVSCQCLEELENEYPGLLFSLMGKKTIDMLNLNCFRDFDDSKSVTSRTSLNEKRPISTKSNKSDIPVFDNKKIELENFGLYNLIEEEVFYVFQNYLSLYTIIFKHLIDYYFFENYIKLNYNEDIHNNIQNGCQSMIIQNTQLNESSDVNEVQILNRDIADPGEDKLTNKNVTLGLFSIRFLNFLNNIPYLKRFQAFGTSHSSLQKNSNSKSQSSSKKDYNVNNANFFMGNCDKKFDKILHIRDCSIGLKYTSIFDKIDDEAYESSQHDGISLSGVFLSYINKALSRIIHLLPKTGEMIQSKICKSLKFIISRTEINHNALLPFFSYFHLNSNSTILTLTAIKIVESFKYALKENFILKLVLKLCLLINDLRINKALRILAIRWILNFRFSNYNFNFDKYMTIFSYYLCPFPFDNVMVCLEKLKTLYLFYRSISSKESVFIIKSIFIMDNYKYYPIFSNNVKSLFKAYFFIILRFPYKKFIHNLCEILRNNLKEVPRILPNMINLLRIIRKLDSNCEITKLKSVEETEDLNDMMTFEEIHEYLLIEFSKFIAEFNSHTKLHKYFELFIEIAKEQSIDPKNLIVGLRNLHNSIQEMRNWKTEKNILEVCKYLLKHHDIHVMKQNKIHELLFEISTKSFDYGIRDKAKLYYKLVTNVEKPMLNTFLETKNTEFNFLDVSYDYVDHGLQLKTVLCLEQSKTERFKDKIEDGGSALLDQNFKQNILLLANQKKHTVYNRPISKINSQDLNDLNSTEEINKIIKNIISPEDILRLFIDDKNIDEINDSKIDPKLIFEYDREFVFYDDKIQENLNEENFLDKFLEDYFLMISKNKFHIKLPINVFMKSTLENVTKMYSISLCFGRMSHLDIKGPNLIPYLELNEQEGNLQFPYFYKIYLIIYPSQPIPSDVEVRAVFYDDKGVCNTGILNSIKIQFEDFFLPISVSPQYQNIYDQPEGRIKLREVLFKKLWRLFKVNNKNFKNFVNTSRMIDKNSDDMIKTVFARLGPFLINDKFKNLNYFINIPYEETYLNLNKINEDSNSENSIQKDYYDFKSGKFKTNSYDFIMDEFLEKNAEKSHFSKHNILKPSLYNLAEVIVFIPEKFHIVMKIKISEFSTIIEIRSDCLKIIEYLDEYFDTWLN